MQTQERVLLNTSKEDICNVNGEVVKTDYVGGGRWVQLGWGGGTGRKGIQL